jgi:hypothetical protein
MSILLSKFLDNNLYLISRDDTLIYGFLGDDDPFL